MGYVLGIVSFLVAITPISVLFAFGSVMSMIFWVIAIGIAAVAVLAGDRVFAIATVIVAGLSVWIHGPFGWWTAANADQFRTYLLFAIIWPCIFAAIYIVLERLLPRLLVVDHSDE